MGNYIRSAEYVRCGRSGRDATRSGNIRTSGRDARERYPGMLFSAIIVPVLAILCHFVFVFPL